MNKQKDKSISLVVGYDIELKENKFDYVKIYIVTINEDGTYDYSIYEN